jgi:hypothetical protein
MEDSTSLTPDCLILGTRPVWARTAANEVNKSELPIGQRSRR